MQPVDDLFESHSTVAGGDATGGGGPVLDLLLPLLTSLLGVAFSDITSKFASQVELAKQTRANLICRVKSKTLHF